MIYAENGPIRIATKKGGVKASREFQTGLCCDPLDGVSIGSEQSKDRFAFG